ncbi:MAG: ATP-binding cassette domain-containing protein [Eubacteriales bacterium]|jgi:NitT/TauT family transport system ATP-binding protein
MDIVVSDLVKSYRDNLVLDRFSATFKESQITCLMGPSGCGKTTLLNILMGLLSPDSGTVEGVPHLKSAVFQEDRLCEGFNAVSNVALVCGKKVDKAEIMAQLGSIGIDEFIKPVSEFSGGMKRRVAIVRAIMARSDVIFLDEPFKGLDEKTKGETIQYVKNNVGDRTVIMVTHNIEEVKALGGQLIEMDNKA